MRALAAALFITLAASSCAAPLAPGWEREPFPHQVNLGRTITSSVDSGGREGCVFAAIELSDDTASAIATQGVAFFRDQVTGRGGQALLEWAETPMATRRLYEQFEILEPLTIDGGVAYGARGAWTCDTGGVTPETLRRAFAAIDDAGAYYTTFNGGEGVLYIIPAERVAVYRYFG